MEEEAGEAKNSTPEDDDVLREQSFKRPTGLNLDSFMVSDSVNGHEDVEASQEPVSPKPSDAAVGEVRDLFTMDDTRERNADPTTELAVHAEQTIGKGLAVAMVVVWTAIGALVGTVLPPVLGGLGLLLMAGVGLYLGERWIQRNSMHLLGIKRVHATPRTTR